jgi:carbon storage regulator CsrA
MLILTRGQNESIIIDGNIKVTILGTKGQDVKIGERSKGTHAFARDQIGILSPEFLTF